MALLEHTQRTLSASALSPIPQIRQLWSLQRTDGARWFGRIETPLARWTTHAGAVSWKHEQFQGLRDVFNGRAEKYDGDGSGTARGFDHLEAGFALRASHPGWWSVVVYGNL
jgi:hypothetical protein